MAENDDLIPPSISSIHKAIEELMKALASHSIDLNWEEPNPIDDEAKERHRFIESLKEQGF